MIGASAESKALVAKASDYRFGEKDGKGLEHTLVWIRTLVPEEEKVIRMLISNMPTRCILVA